MRRDQSGPNVSWLVSPSTNGAELRDDRGGCHRGAETTPVAIGVPDTRQPDFAAVGSFQARPVGGDDECQTWHEPTATDHRAGSADSGTPGIQPGGGGARPTSALFDRSWRWRSRVAPIKQRDGTWLIERHYLGKWPGTRVCVLGMFVDSVLRGIVVFSLPPRETGQRYASAVTWELSRLWIDDGVPRNAESWLLAQAVRHVRRNHPDVRCLVSYADPSVGHQGTIYRAAGWRADGWTDQGRLVPRFDYVDQRTGKRYGRRAHVPIDAVIRRVRRGSKYRFFLRIPTASTAPSWSVPHDR